ncbi:hypothetical protein N183_11965 [Sinorhizobium sp. Sb3]|uniref:hypothetical protein n=1 Tax=Sinorhizobium sp. Sb3 TaxID=1358417 RepID=UPI00071CAD9C|nr:hypothetical protein [Sinorhizobium sp. Sb3]KSV84535.1 hypothetical protein N183_11965 [Sinorhizobium sp. Sb3]
MRFTIVVIAYLCAPAVSAFAMTGAELLQTDRQFGIGYVFGVVEFKTGVLDRDDPNFYRIRQCVLDAGINSNTLYELVTRYMRNNPDNLPLPAFGGVLKAIDAMCLPNGR